MTSVGDEQIEIEFADIANVSVDHWRNTICNERKARSFVLCPKVFVLSIRLETKIIFLLRVFQITVIGLESRERMITYSIKQLMGLCADYALDAQIQKILFSLDLWVPKAARVCSTIEQGGRTMSRLDFV